MEMTAVRARQAEREVSRTPAEANTIRFRVGDRVLLRETEAVRALAPKWHPPYTLTQETHQTYKLRKDGGKRWRRAINATRLVTYERKRGGAVHKK